MDTVCVASVFIIVEVTANFVAIVEKDSSEEQGELTSWMVGLLRLVKSVKQSWELSTIRSIIPQLFRLKSGSIPSLGLGLLGFEL